MEAFAERVIRPTADGRLTTPVAGAHRVVCSLQASRQGGPEMSDKPSYLGLLNAIANGESQAECYLNAWAEVDARRRRASGHLDGRAPRGRARQGVREAAVRARLHACSPARIRSSTRRWTIAGDKHLTDREKFEKLGFSPAERSEPSGPTSSHVVRRQDDRHPDRRAARSLHRRGARQRPHARGVLPTSCAQPRTATRSRTATAATCRAQLGRIEDLLEKLVAKKARATR